MSQKNVDFSWKGLEFSGLGLIWDNIPEFVLRNWGKPRRTRLYVVCWSRFEPLTSRIRIRRAVYPTAACDGLCVWYTHIACVVYSCVGVPILLCFGSLSFEYLPFNYVACKLPLMYVRWLYSVFSVHYIQPAK